MWRALGCPHGCAPGCGNKSQTWILPESGHMKSRCAGVLVCTVLFTYPDARDELPVTKGGTDAALGERTRGAVTHRAPPELLFTETHLFKLMHGGC